MFHGLSTSHRRLVVFAATVFFISSVFICATRLAAYSFDRGSIKGTTGKGNPGKKDFKDPKGKIKLTHADLPMSYGEFDRPALDGVTLLGAVPPELVPTVENGRRLVVVGDIHGMDLALEAMLSKVAFNEATDHLVAVGDMVSKGPDSAGVISRLMKLNASAVRGNHEDRVLLAQRELDLQYGVSAELETLDVQNSKGELTERFIARSLSREQLAWLAALPVILTVDPLPIYIVHAGLVPGVDIARQDPWAVMNMRTIVYPREELRRKEKEQPRLGRRDEPPSAEPTGDSADAAATGLATSQPTTLADDDVDTSDIGFDRAVLIPVETREGEKWSEVWNAYQKRLRKEDRRTVVYGHDAKTGYKEGRYTFGLDSACVRGEALTALVIEATEGGGFKQLTYQVKCRAP